MKELTKHQQNLIDRLFEGRLPKGEQGRLEEEMENADFRAAVEFRRDIQRAFALDEAGIGKTKLQEREKRIETDNEKDIKKPIARVIPMRRILAVAAGVLILAVAVWFGKDLILSPSLPIALEFLDIPPEHSIAGGPSPEQLLLAGKDAFYRDKKYAKAEASFEQVDARSGYFSEAQYLLAHSLMQQQKFTEAVPIFDSFLTDNAKFETLPGRYRNLDQIRFERMLGYLGAEQDNAFRPELEFFLNHPDDYYKEKAQALKQRLEEKK